jgi:uncharacterized protein DUF4202
MPLSTKLTSTLSAIDDINKQDPNKVLSKSNEANQQFQAKELIYGQQMSKCLNNYWPNSDEVLQIAVRAQHIKRWHIKRTEFAQGKAGYYKWRIVLGKFHAQLTEKIMLEQNYSAELAAATASILRKENLKTNSNAQTLEDVACLVFLQHYFDDFASKHNDEKIIRILQKTWAKMSAQAQDIALTLSLPAHLLNLVKKALAG